MAPGEGACRTAWAAVELSLAGGLGGGDDLGPVLGEMVVSLRISFPRMGATSGGLGWWH